MIKSEEHINSVWTAVLPVNRSRQGCHRTIFLIVAIFLTSLGYSQPTNPPPSSNGSNATLTAPPLPQFLPAQQPLTVLDFEKQLLDFQNMLAQRAKDHENFLQTEEDNHQKFLEKCYTNVAIMVAIATGVFIFFNFRTYKDIRAMVKQRITAVADEQIEQAMAKVNTNADKTKQIANDAIRSFKDHLANHKKIVADQVAGLQSEFKGEVHNSIMLATSLARACTIINQQDVNGVNNDGLNQERKDVIEKLKKIQTTWAPTNRTVILFVGRLYKQLKQYRNAVQALDEVLAKRVERGEDKGNDNVQDQSDILFNRACYLNLEANQVAEKGGEPSKVESLRQDAWETIKTAVKMWPANLEDATKDTDFANLINETRTWASLTAPLSKSAS